MLIADKDGNEMVFVDGMHTLFVLLFLALIKLKNKSELNRIYFRHPLPAVLKITFNNLLKKLHDFFKHFCNKVCIK